MEPKDKIYELRKKIDECDDKMLDLLVKRFSIAKKIGEIKASSGFNIEDQNREKKVRKSDPYTHHQKTITKLRGSDSLIKESICCRFPIKSRCLGGPHKQSMLLGFRIAIYLNLV